MEKSQELKILESCVQQLGPDSYCGPWLTELLPSIAADLQSDFVPQCVMPRIAYGTAREILAGARVEAEKITDKAKVQAETIIESAKQNARCRRIEIAMQLRKATDQLD